MKAGTVRTTAALGGLTVAEKVLAAARHVLLAALLGAGAAMDALVIGVSVAELLVALVTGSFLAVFIPLHAEWRQREGPAGADRRGLNLILVLMAVLGAAAVALAWRGGALAGWIGYGLSGGQKAEAAALMPWLAVFLWFSGAAVLLTGLYHVRGRFLTPQAAQLAERLVVLAILALAVPAAGTVGVAAAMAVGAALLTMVLAAVAWRRRGWPRPRLAPQAPEVRAYLFLFLPLLGAAVVDQAVLFTDRAMASSLPVGSVSALYYASVLWGLPVIFLCTNFCTVLFPRLAQDVASGDAVALARSLSFGLRSMVVVMLGATVLVVMLAGDLTAVVLQRGRFDAASATLTGRALAALALCLVFQGVGSVVNMALYAARRTGVVAACGVGRVLLNVLFNFLLIDSFGAVGIALSTSLTLALWLGLIWRPFRREMALRGVSAPLDRAPGGFLLRTGVAALAAAAAAWGAGALMAGDGLPLRLARLTLAGAAGAGVYAVSLLALRVEEAGAALRLVSRRLGIGGAAS